MITARDDDMVRTHDEALSLLRESVPGARVALIPAPQAGDRVRRYAVTLERVGHLPSTASDVYSLPCRAAPLARRAREIADTVTTHTAIETRGRAP